MDNLEKLKKMNEGKSRGVFEMQKQIDSISTKINSLQTNLRKYDEILESIGKLCPQSTLSEDI